jgi:hypothetical protein
MKLHSKFLGLSLFAATLFAGTPAAAQRLQVSIGAHGVHGSIGVGPQSDRAFGYGRSRAARSYAGAARVSGHYETVYRKVWVEGRHRKQWMPPVYELRERCSVYGGYQSERVLVRHGYWRQVREPGYYVKRAVRVWIPGHGGRF